MEENYREEIRQFNAMFEREVKQMTIPIHDARHPARQTAIEVMEIVSEMLDKPTMFDGDYWYNFEDAVTEVIAKHFPESVTKEELESFIS